jgi:O-antigen biosynthesis protein
MREQVEIAAAASPFRAKVCRVDEGVQCGLWDEPQDTLERPSTFIYGTSTIPSPYARLDIPLPQGGYRRLVTFKGLFKEGHPFAAINGASIMAAGQVPVSFPEMINGLSVEGKNKLLRFLVDTSRNLLRPAAEQYAPACQRLVRAVFPHLPSALAVLDVGHLPALALVPAPKGFGNIQKAYVLSDVALQPLATPPRMLDSGVLLVQGEAAVSFDAPGATLLLFDDQMGAAALHLSAVHAPRSHIVEWLYRRRPHHHRLRLQLLKQIAALQEENTLFAPAQALLKDIDTLAPLPPRRLTSSKEPVGGALELCINDGIGGVFLKGWMRDPKHLITDILLSSAEEPVQSIKSNWHSFPRPEIDRHYKEAAGTTTGFIAYVALPKACVQPGVLLKMASGATIPLVPKIMLDDAVRKRAAILGSLPPEAMGATALDALIAPPIERLQQQIKREDIQPTIHEFGSLPTAPVWSVIIPLYKNLEYLRYQLSAFALDKDIHRTEILYVLDSPEQQGQLLHYLRGLHGVYHVPLKVLVMPHNTGYSTANNTAALAAQGHYLALLNSDIVPTEPGWLTAMTTTLERHEGAMACGARLLFEDQSLQHAGMYFAKDAGGHWLNVHYFKGAPRNFPPALLEREVPAITGAAVLLRRKDFESVRGFSTDYVIGDYEDSDLCLKLRAQGGRIFYSPNAVLYHFERKSITRHQGYTQTVAGLYNRRLAAHKWGTAMDKLMQRLGNDACRFV